MSTEESVQVGENEYSSTDPEKVTTEVYQTHGKLMRKTIDDGIDFLTNYSGLDDMPKMNSRIRKLAESATSFEKSRTVAIIKTYEEMSKLHEPPSNPEEELYKLWMLRFCHNMTSETASLLDDVLDDVKIRDDDVSWFYKNDCNPIVTYDGVLLHFAARVMMNKYFHNHKDYYTLQKIITNEYAKGSWGQICDLTIPEKYLKKKNDDICLEDIYYTYVPYKTDILSPAITLAMAMVGEYTSEHTRIIEDVCHLLLVFWQHANDLKDVYKGLTLANKPSEDISTGRFSILIITALQLCDERQHQILLDNYGKKDDPTKLQEIITIYEDLRLKDVVMKKQQRVMQLAKEAIEKISDPAVKKILKVLTKPAPSWFI